MFGERTILDRSESQGWVWGICWGLAFFLHLFFLWIPFHFQGSSSSEDGNQEIVVEEWIEESKPVVQTSRPRELENTEAEARFGGEFKNRVKEEMKSPNLGHFRQGGQAGSQLQKEGDLQLSDLLPFASSQNSALPDDVLEGNETLLNTDPVRYASFLNRIRDEIYGPWVRRINEISHVLRRRLSSNLYVTLLKVVVDKEGSVLSIRTLKSSGSTELDGASKHAFWEAEPFPNPPIQVAGNEETLPFVFEFHFEMKKSFFSILPWGT